MPDPGFLTLLAAAASTAGTGARPTTLAVQVERLAEGGRLPARSAFCPPAGVKRYDVSPLVRWSRGPRGTRSYAIVMTDPDVPADLTVIGREDRTIPPDEPRQRVHHWILVDIPASATSLARGADGAGPIRGGKPTGRTPHGVRGANVYTTFLRGDPSMAGTYGGYDGPCPPINDERVHRYVFSVFALDVQHLGLAGPFDGDAAEKAMLGHVLASGSTTALYDRRPAR